MSTEITGRTGFVARPRTAITLSRETMVSIEPSDPRAATIPVVFRPAVGGVNLAAWAADNRRVIDERLLEQGALLFRGFPLENTTQFSEAAKALSSGLMEYGERSSPRTRISDGVFTSTEHPPGENILLHNEQSYTLNWPMRIFFFCVQPALSGGRTPIAGTRQILKRLPPVIVERFREKRVMYVRNYGEGLGLSWQEVFQTSDRSVVEEHCRRASIDVVWKDNNRLRTQQVRPALRHHPITGELLWFNHAAFFHFSSLPAGVREQILSVMDEENVAFNTFYGDGSAIEPEVLDTIRAAYQDATVRFDWKQGDLLLLDNMLVAHGRESFEGPRKVAVALAQPVDASAEE
jgi:alpha-ketoglutarate-dependent taurine dioxygenase